MVLINIEYLDVNFPNYSYTLKEIVDVFFQQKLDDPIKKFAKNGTGIDRVYKSYDLSKITEDQSEYLPPHIRLNDMYVKIAEKALEASKKGWRIVKVEKNTHEFNGKMYDSIEVHKDL